MNLSVSRIEHPGPATGLSSVSWIPGANLAYDEWLRQGARLGVAGRNASWWVGDWLRYGTRRYGRNYAAAARITGYDRQTLMNLVYVASRYEFSRRRENLSWSHHAELAGLDFEEQEYWLDRAAEDHFSVRDLRDELRTAVPDPDRRRSEVSGASGRRQSSLASRSRSQPAADQPSEPDSAGQPVVCPQCGHGFRV